MRTFLKCGITSAVLRGIISTIALVANLAAARAAQPASLNWLTGNVIVATAPGLLHGTSLLEKLVGPTTKIAVGDKLCVIEVYADSTIFVMPQNGGQKSYTKYVPRNFTNDPSGATCGSKHTATPQPTTAPMEITHPLPIILPIIGAIALTFFWAWKRRQKGIAFFTPADHWKVWTVAAFSAVTAILYHLIRVFQVDRPEDHTPGELLTYFVAACSILYAWQYIGGKAAGSQKRRSALWELNKNNWTFNKDSGYHYRILRKDSAGMVIYDNTTRNDRMMDESYGFSARMIAALFVYPVTFILIIFGQAFYAFFPDSPKSNWPLGISLFGMFLLALMASGEIRYQGGFTISPRGARGTTKYTRLFFHYKMHGGGSMVIDPPAQLPSMEDFGPQSITTAPDHPAEDDLTYKPTV